MNINGHNEKVIRPCFQDKGAMLLKCESTLVKVGLRYTLTLNFLLQIITSTSRNGSEGPEAFMHVKRRLRHWLLSTFVLETKPYHLFIVSCLFIFIK